jgi:hypothetical protein
MITFNHVHLLQIEKDFVISVCFIFFEIYLFFFRLRLNQVRPLEKLNNHEQIQINLDEIDLSYSFTMIETMTYFEAYRPVLNALQLIAADQTFPLAPFLLKLNNEMVPPDYITPTTTFDFTPLLVEPKSEVKATVTTHEILPAQPRRPNYRGTIQPITAKEFRIKYKQSNQVEGKYKSVSLLNKDQWPTSDELHLNPKQREALILALTNKVALIQGRKYFIFF